MKLGDLVVRKSYGGDVLFRVAALLQNTAVLRGTDYRLLADAPVGDLAQVRNPDELRGPRTARVQASESVRRMQEERAQIKDGTDDEAQSGQGKPYFEMPGKVLHLDGDVNYLKKSMAVYRQLRMPAEGVHCHESQMAAAVADLLPKVRPDIVVITGHDGVFKNRSNYDLLTSYKNTGNFLQAVKNARSFDRNKDSLIVVAGACQSHFEALMSAGANFASSPARIMIHALDPVYVAVRAAFTPFRETIDLPDVISHTISGMRGVGGVETMGKYRIGIPNIKPTNIVPTLAAAEFG
ncbi:sporulation peptidase YabG [Cohnella sp. JJ-181]|uniref:sporulation peptidase YabG n=1 Tax=Cohnella rhizoplanae TaxID=2974897 RepID=UPI0022FF9F56|nr:sporulation peptidase YabG [Cohnella sp. JJ-181]CAI6084805.1 Sporulation-specific protease YabG [Cohnella sp. JJ-181]